MTKGKNSQKIVMVFFTHEVERLERFKKSKESQFKKRQKV